MNLRKLEINQVSVKIWDNNKPQNIAIHNTLASIRNKLELTIQMKGVDFIIERYEYKLFEDLYEQRKKLKKQQHVVFDNNLINEYPKHTHFLSSAH